MMGTPIFDQLHREMFAERAVRFVSDEKFQKSYRQEKARWAGLSERLKRSGD